MGAGPDASKLLCVEDYMYYQVMENLNGPDDKISLAYRMQSVAPGVFTLGRGYVEKTIS